MQQIPGFQPRRCGVIRGRPEETADMPYGELVLLFVGEIPPSRLAARIINLKNKKWAEDFSALDPGGPSRVDEEYSKAYLRHLFTSHEMLGMQIASIHNLTFYLWLVKEARRHIVEGDFKQWKEEMTVNVTRRL